jgi:hypothetical protein
LYPNPAKTATQEGIFKTTSLKITAQTVTLHNLEPDCYYDLLVYSIGLMANEGGVFSGAVEGVAYGGAAEGDFWASRFIPGTNYIQNPFARSDSTGTLEFTIKPTSSIFKDGFYNGDFNGLQIVKVAGNTPPAIHFTTTAIFIRVHWPEGILKTSPHCLMRMVHSPLPSDPLPPLRLKVFATLISTACKLCLRNDNRKTQGRAEGFSTSRAERSGICGSSGLANQ